LSPWNCAPVTKLTDGPRAVHEILNAEDLDVVGSTKSFFPPLNLNPNKASLAGLIWHPSSMSMAFVEQVVPNDFIVLNDGRLVDQLSR